MAEIGCYALVGSIAALLVCAEVLTTFGTAFFSAILSRWAALLIALNIVFACSAFFFARLFLKVESGLATAVVVGVLYPLLLRSRFTFFRRVGAKDDDALNALSVRMDKLYTALQTRCYRECDAAMAFQRTVQALGLFVHSEARMVEALKQLIAARRVAAEMEADEQFFQEILQLPAGDDRKFQLALFLVDIAGDKAGQLLGNRAS